MTRGIALVTAAAILGFATSAAAAPRATPSGWVGACNMMASWPGYSPGNGVAVQPGGGMENAMTRNTSQNTNGNDGMFRAVDRTGGVC